MIGALIARKAVANAFKALNRHDLATFMAAWSDDGVFYYPGDIPASGAFQGKDAVEGWFRDYFNQFPEIRYDIKDICTRNIFALTGTNVVSVHWDVHLKNRSGGEGHISGVTVISIKGGRVSMVRDFIFDLGENFRLTWGAA